MLIENDALSYIEIFQIEHLRMNKQHKEGGDNNLHRTITTQTTLKHTIIML